MKPTQGVGIIEGRITILEMNEYLCLNLTTAIEYEGTGAVGAHLLVVQAGGGRKLGVFL